MNLAYFKELFPDKYDSLIAIRKRKYYAHGYLVYSDSLKIREEFPRFFAKILMCRGEGEGVEIPCDKCLCCRELNRKGSLDFYELSPSSKTRKIVIGLGENDYGSMRWFRSRFSYSSSSILRWKIGVIYDADCLTIQAQNGFLKMLEEPSNNTIFILVTAKPNSIISTIRSRCQIIALLTNNVSYSFKELNRLYCDILPSLIDEHLDFIRAVEIIDALVNVFQNLRNEAELNIKRRWEERMVNVDNIAKKEEKREFDLAVDGEYRRLRGELLDAIFVWFVLIYKKAINVDLGFESLPSLEDNIFEKIGTIPEDRAIRFVRLAEDFLKTFNWNVDEKLAIINFVFSFLRVKKVGFREEKDV